MIAPPSGAVLCPTETLRPGDRLYRVHEDRVDRGPLMLNHSSPPPAPEWGRFDCIDDAHGYTYMSDSDFGAIAESFCRAFELDGEPMYIDAQHFQYRRISVLEVETPITVAKLYGPSLTHIGASNELVAGTEDGYDTTRLWAQSIFNGTPSAEGLKYSSRMARFPFNYMLIGQRQLTSLSVIDTHPLLSGTGRLWLDKALERFSAVIGT